MERENEIDVNGLRFRVHPVYDQYGASRCGKLLNIETILLGSPGMNGVNCSVRSVNSKKYKKMTLQKFVYECYHGLVPARKVIKHIDGDVLNNRLSNLFLK